MLKNINADLSQVKPIEREYFMQPTLQVAQDLIGCVLRVGERWGVITETEAYVGQDDPACHAARGVTKRTQIMFGAPGHAYIYFIYGMYYCLNIVTEKEGFPAAVLIRGIQLVHPYKKWIDGPGKLCRELSLNTSHNGLDICSAHQGGHMQVYYGTVKYPLCTTPRIGISKAREKPWRFVVNLKNAT